MAFYKDVNSLTPTDRPDVVGAASIYQSLRNLLNTRKNERPFVPDYGIDLEDELFELMGPATELEVLSKVFDAVARYEPRALIEKGQSFVDLFPDENRMEVELVFKIEGLGDQLFNITQGFKR